jgi:alpha-tubulin suppressor-like RCC1 family protein
MKINSVIDCRLINLLVFLPLLGACGGGGGGGGGVVDSGGTPQMRSSFQFIAAGGASNCGIDVSTFGLSCWGQNDVGQLGTGNSANPTTSPASVNLGVGKSAKRVTIGIEHACAILNDDTVGCWGSNSAGQLGTALTTSNSSSPIFVPGITAKALALGFEHTCVITLLDNVKCWGSNSKGQLGQPLGAPLQTDAPQDINGLTAKVIRSGIDHVCVIAMDDTVKCWGDNQHGQLGDNSNSDSVTPVSASGLSNVITLSAGAYHSCASTSSAINCWGRNDAGQLGSNSIASMNVPTPTTAAAANVSQLVAGLSHTCSLSGTTVNCWGSNASRQLSGLSPGGNAFVPVSLSSTPLNLSAGLNHTCVQDSANRTYCWGAGSQGRLGPNALANSATPVLVP